MKSSLQIQRCKTTRSTNMRRIKRSHVHAPGRTDAMHNPRQVETKDARRSLTSHTPGLPFTSSASDVRRQSFPGHDRPSTHHVPSRNVQRSRPPRGFQLWYQGHSDLRSIGQRLLAVAVIVFIIVIVILYRNLEYMT